MNKLVSVIIPTYKRPDTLSRAIDSVLHQTYKPIEIIVVDDNNPDSIERAKTERVMSGYEGRVIYIKHEKNKNGSAARNTGAKFSKGEYLAFLDDDDEYLPSKIYEQVRKLEQLDESWGACYCKYYKKRGDTIIAKSAESREGWVAFDELCRNFWHGGGSGPLVRRSVFENINGFNDKFIRNQDYEYMLRLTRKYKLAFVNIFGTINYVDAYRETKINFKDTLDNYLETFQEYIKELDDVHYRKFRKIIGLQLFRNYLFEEKKICLALKELKKNHISVWLVFRYICYLIYRKVFKISCGFEI